MALDDVRSTAGCEIRAWVATRNDIIVAINRNYRSEGELDDLSLAIDTDEEEIEDLASIRQVTEWTRPSSNMGTAHHPGHQQSGLRTSTSSRRRHDLRCGSASMVCSTR